MTPAASPLQVARVLVSGPASCVAEIDRTLARLGFRVLGAPSLRAAIEIAGRYRPDVLIADVGAGEGPQDLKLADVVRAQCGASVVVLTDRSDRAAIAAIARHDPSAIVHKPWDRRQLEITLGLVVERRAQAHESRRRQSGGDLPSTAQPFELALRRIAQELDRVGLGPSAPVPDPEMLGRLRPRERDVVRLLLRHYRVPAIARELAISPQTVRNHLKRVFRAAGVHSQQQLLECLHGRVDASPAQTGHAVAHSGHPQRTRHAD